MKFGDPKPKTSQNKPHNIEVSNKNLKLELRSFLQGKINKLLQQSTEQPDKKHFVINQLAQAKETWFQEKGELLDAILARVETIHYDNDAQFEKDVVEELMKIIMEYIASKGYSAKEVFENFRIMRIEQDENIPLDEHGVLYCSKWQDEIEIHITRGLDLNIWDEAMSKLAQIVQEDEGIKNVKGKSWVAYKHPAFFKKYGFHVSEIKDEEELKVIRANFDEGMKEHINDPISLAEMSREEFLKRWLKK